MSLNKNDISRVSYKAKIDWYKQRAFDISDGKISLEDYLAEKNKDFELQDHDPDELISILDDLSSKAKKLEDKISFLSAKLYIPVDKTSQPELFNAIAELDPSSNGERITYQLYDKILREQEYAYNKVDLNYVVNNTTGDIHSDSLIVYDRIFQGFSDYNKQSVPDDNAAQRYTNRWLNNIVSWNEHDYKIRQILNFSDNYLDINPDPAYIPWKMRRDVGEERVDAEKYSDLWKYFSESYSAKVNDMVDGIKGIGALRPDPTIKDLTARYIVYTNSFLNKVNDVFDMNWAVDLVCCFMQWGVRLDLKTLKGLRAMLQLLQTGLFFDFRDVLNGIKDILNNIFRGLLCNQVIGFIKQILQGLVDPIKRWIHQPNDTWRKIFACTPIDELINKYIVEAIDYIERLLTNFIQNWYKKIELQNIKNSIKLDIISSQKWAGELAKILDAIIAVTERAAQCGMQWSPEDEEVKQLISNYGLKADSTSYVFPVENNPTIYNSFIPDNPVDRSEVSASPATTTKFDQGAVGGKVSTNRPSGLDECMKKIPAEDVFGVEEWSK
jgi:hypothetical protein